MNRRFFIAAAGAALLVPLATPAAAHSYKHARLVIRHPWTRATPKGAKVAGGYMTIVNEGDSADRLVAVTTSAAAKAELHEMAEQSGVMKMRPLPEGIAVPPGATVTLAPGGLHVMLVDLKGALTEGESVPAQLIFEKAGPVDVSFKVESLGARGDKGHSGH